MIEMKSEQEILNGIGAALLSMRSGDYGQAREVVMSLVDGMAGSEPSVSLIRAKDLIETLDFGRAAAQLKQTAEWLFRQTVSQRPALNEEAICGACAMEESVSVKNGVEIVIKPFIGKMFQGKEFVLALDDLNPSQTEELIFAVAGFVKETVESIKMGGMADVDLDLKANNLEARDRIRENNSKQETEPKAWCKLKDGTSGTGKSCTFYKEMEIPEQCSKCDRKIEVPLPYMMIVELEKLKKK